MKNNGKQIQNIDHRICHFRKILTPDILTLISHHCVKHPHHFIMLGMVNKEFNKHLNCKRWWDAFYSNVLINEMNLLKSKHLNNLHEIYSFTKQDSKTTLRLVYGKTCQYCGRAKGNYVLKTLTCRICKSCLHFNLVSNGRLYFQYGISYYDIIQFYTENGGFVVPASCFEKVSRKRKKRIFPEYHTSNNENSWQIQQYIQTDNKNIVFLWIPDIQRIFGEFNPDRCQYQQKRRIEAAQFLTARCIRIANKKHEYFMVKNHNSFEGQAGLLWVKQLLILERLRPYLRIPIPKIWIPGGPFYSYYDLHKSHRKLGDFWWRPGFDMQTIYKIRHIFTRCRESIISNRHIEIIFKLL